MKFLLTFNLRENIMIFIITLIAIRSIQSANNNLKSKSSQLFLPSDSCSCAMTIPPCCSQELTTYNCPCAQRPVCGACPNSDNSYVNMHDNMMKLAMKDAYNQQDLTRKAKLQVDLFQKAQEYAKEVGIQEMKAKQYANILNEKTKKAQFSRSMMLNAANQVTYLTDQTIRAIQPIICVGMKCNNGNQVNFDNMINLSSNMIQDSGFNAFMFRQKENNEVIENKNYNLRASIR